MNRVQLCGQLLADPEIHIKKNGAMKAYLLLETYSNWQTELGKWEYGADIHHITVYKEKSVLFLQDKVSQGDQIVVQGLLTYGDNDELSRTKKRAIHIIVPRQNGLIFQVKENPTLPKTKPSLPSQWGTKLLETANENKSSKNLEETE